MQDMLLSTFLPVQLPLCVQALSRLSAAAVCSQIQPFAVQQPLPGQPTPIRAHHRSFSTSSSADSSWLPASVTRLIKRQQRGQSNFPTSPLQAGHISPTRLVPNHIPRPHYATAKAAVSGGSKGPGLSKQPEIMSDEASRAAMRAAGQLAAQALQLAGGIAVPGTTTDDIDAAVHDFLISKKAYPSPLHYHGFPKSICTSVNEAVCHGVPDSRQLQDGDLLNVDVTAYLNGFHGDTNATFCIGQPSDAALQLVEVTRQSLQAAIDVCGPGVPFRAIGSAISSMADKAGMYVNRDFVGHGIGTQFHAAPAVLHHRNVRAGSMQLWQTFTIEPILALGTWKQQPWPLDQTGWTCVTPDGSLTAQFEQTIMVTEDGAEVLTKSQS